MVFSASPIAGDPFEAGTTTLNLSKLGWFSTYFSLIYFIVRLLWIGYTWLDNKIKVL